MRPLKIFGISGLGADERSFELLNQHLPVPISYIPWLRHKPDETLPSYAARMSEIFEDEEGVLLGLSFGGMLSAEIKKLQVNRKVILLSSAACRTELPLIYRGAGRLNATKYIPSSLLRPPQRLLHFAMSVHDPDNRKLADSIMDDTDKEFLKWAMGAITRWEAQEAPLDLYRIHGDSDHIIPLTVEPDTLISGGHMIVMEQAESVAKAILKIIELK